METTQADLKAEIAHTQTLQNRNIRAQREPPGSALRGRAGQDTLVNDPKHGVTIRLYEDLTNLIVLSAKFQESPYAHLGELEEITYKCVFSHMNTGECFAPQRPHTFVLTYCLQQASRSCLHLCTNPGPLLSQATPPLVLKPRTIFNTWCDIPHSNSRRNPKNIFGS